MPHNSQQTEPETFLEYKDISVYHTYKDDDMNRGAREYWYTVSEECGEYSCGECGDNGFVHFFDVRDLPTYALTADHKNVIRHAIDAGEITSEGQKITEKG